MFVFFLSCNKKKTISQDSRNNLFITSSDRYSHHAECIDIQSINDTYIIMQYSLQTYFFAMYFYSLIRIPV